MVKKLFKKDGIIFISNNQLSMKQCYFIIMNYHKDTKERDYLLNYYKKQGCQY